MLCLLRHWYPTDTSPHLVSRRCLYKGLLSRLHQGVGSIPCLAAPCRRLSARPCCFGSPHWSAARAASCGPQLPPLPAPAPKLGPLDGHASLESPTGDASIRRYMLPGALPRPIAQHAPHGMSSCMFSPDSALGLMQATSMMIENKGAAYSKQAERVRSDHLLR